MRVRMPMVRCSVKPTRGHGKNLPPTHPGEGTYLVERDDCTHCFLWVYVPTVRCEVTDGFRGLHELERGLQGQGKAQSGDGPPWQEEAGAETGGGRWTG